MLSYAYIIAPNAMGKVKKIPTQQAAKPASLINPHTTARPKTSHQCLPTIRRLALIAGQNSICLSMISGRENIQQTLK